MPEGMLCTDVLPDPGNQSHPCLLAELFSCVTVTHGMTQSCYHAGQGVLLLSACH